MSIKNRKEQEKAMRREGRLPPGQVLTEKFPVLHYGPVPAFNEESWHFQIFGAVEKPLKLSWAEFSQLPRIRNTYDLHCVTRWSKFNTDWEGVPLSYFLDEELVKLKPDARFIMQHAEYGFSANLPLDIALSERFLLATHFNGEPITPEHGYPLRGLVGAHPGKQSERDVYLWKGAKWLRGVEFMTADRKGFWETAGYHNEGNVWEEQRLG
jgi:DMSO/TMAO reductase YedYZ molybdopterin-dependent catalytic subunit